MVCLAISRNKAEYLVRVVFLSRVKLLLDLKLHQHDGLLYYQCLQIVGVISRERREF